MEVYAVPVPSKFPLVQCNILSSVNPTIAETNVHSAVWDMSVHNFLPYSLLLNTFEDGQSFLQANSSGYYIPAVETNGLINIKATLILYQNQNWTCNQNYDTSNGNGVIKCNFETKDGKSLMLGLHFESYHYSNCHYLSLTFFCPLVVTNTTKFDFFYQEYIVKNSLHKTIRHQKGEGPILMDFDTIDITMWMDDEEYGFRGWLSLTTERQVPYVQDGIGRRLRFKTIRDMDDHPVKGTTHVYIRDEMDQSLIQRKDSWVKL